MHICYSVLHCVSAVIWKISTLFLANMLIEQQQQQQSSSSFSLQTENMFLIYKTMVI